jgi:hypothetical protein
MSVSDWDNEYARLARAASQLRTTGIVSQPSDRNALTVGLQRLDQSLSNLPLQPTEIQRRRRLIQHLLQTTNTTTTTTNPSTESSLVTPPATTTTTSSSVMAMAMRQQDAMIDELAVGVGRLKTQTAAISEEATMHNRLLNQMDEGLDAAYAGLEDETRRAATLREDQSVWKLQLIVAGLVVLLILEIFLGLTP